MYRLAPTPTVLVVDDDPADLLLADAALAALGLEVVAAVGADAADAFLRACTPGLILVDLALSPESGTDFCRRWRARQRLESVPILLLTTLKAGEHRSAALSAGADDYLEKPFDILTLQRMVRRWIATGRQPTSAPGRDPRSGELAAAMRRAARPRQLAHLTD
jgi:DNA-binding response OmpR family regulator